MNFGKLLNDSVSASEDQPASSSQQEQQRANGLQHILDAATGDSNEGSTTASNAYPATHSVAKDPQLLQQQQNEPGSAPSPSRAPHFTTYGVDPTPMDTDSTVEVPAPAAAFDLLSAAAQQALDPMRSLPDSYLAELNQPVPSSSSTNVGVPLPPAVQVVHASQERRSRRNGTNSLVSPSSVVPDSDEDAEGDADVDAEGEDDEDVVMSDREAKVGSETSSGARRDKSVKTEDEDVSMQGTSPAMEEHWSIHKVHNAGAKPKGAKAKPKTTRAQRKANKVKAGKARAALYGNNLREEPAPVAPSSLRKQLPKNDDEPKGKGKAKEDQDGLKALTTTFPQASTSNLSSSANSPLPSASASAIQHQSFTPRPPQTPLPKGKLSAAFESYVPPKGSDSEDDDFLKAWHHRRKGKGRVQVAQHGHEHYEEENEHDDRLYCICQKMYDPDRVMIACDKCENWYHLDCVGIPIDKVELVDQFICPHCKDPSTYTVTTWKSRCARPTCRKPVAPLSKYCSDYCGIEVAATRLDLCGIDAEYFWPKVVGARRREAQTWDMKKVEVVPLQTDPEAEVNHSRVDEEAARRQEEEEARAVARLEERLRDLVGRREVLEGHLGLVEARRSYLKVAIRRWEALCVATAETLAQEREETERLEAEEEDAEAEEQEDAEEEPEEEQEEEVKPAASTSKPKGKGGRKPKGKPRVNKRKGTRRVAIVGGPTTLPEAQCGLDVRLVFDTAQWQEYVDSEEGRKVLASADVELGEGERVAIDEEDMERVCLMPRKQCDRHTGWQKVREADFETEKSVITRRLDRLATLEGRLRAQVADHEEYAAFRGMYRHRVGTVSALSVDKEMEALAQLNPDEKLARRLLLNTIHQPIPRPQEEIDAEAAAAAAVDREKEESVDPRAEPLTMEEVMATLVQEAEQTDKEREKERKALQRRLDREKARAVRDRAIEKEALAREAADAKREADSAARRRVKREAMEASPELGVSDAVDAIPEEFLSRTELKRRSRR